MVLTTSESTGTLVSLDDCGLKRAVSLEQLPRFSQFENDDDQQSQQELEFRKTLISLPDVGLFPDDNDDDDDNEEQDSGSFYSCMDMDSGCLRQPLYIPSIDSPYSVDECLRCIPAMVESCDDLLQGGVTHYTTASRERILYVAQGEVVHAVPLQCDILVSDKATTCHIMALRSESSHHVPLASMTHIDAAHYDKCVRAMFQQHKLHHHNDTTIRIDVHIMGGFQDENGSSRDISNWLLHLLADIAQEESGFVITLQTCAISSLNDNGRTCPIGRGLAMDMRTGHVHLAKVDSAVAGPAMELRSARLWARCTSHLHTIHNERSDVITIQPFHFAPIRDLDILLSLPDDVLIRYTSTSPDCEDDDFCMHLRNTLHFLRTSNCRSIFGSRLDCHVVYKRSGGGGVRSNMWKHITP